MEEAGYNLQQQQQQQQQLQQQQLQLPYQNGVSMNQDSLPSSDVSRVFFQFQNFYFCYFINKKMSSCDKNFIIIQQNLISMSFSKYFLYKVSLNVTFYIFLTVKNSFFTILKIILFSP